MATQLVYGSFVHAIDECRVSIMPSVIWDGDGPPYVRTQWVIDGEILAQNTAQLIALWQIRVAAYTQRGNLAYYAPTGNLAQSLRWSDTRNGIQFQLPSISPEDGELAVNLRYRIIANAEFWYPLAPQSGLLKFKESFVLSGGGPLIVWSDPIADLPKPIQLKAFTTYKLQQTIEALGRFDYPVVTPIVNSFPPLARNPVISKGSPQYVGAGDYRNYPIQMVADYESALPLQFNPRKVF